MATNKQQLKKLLAARLEVQNAINSIAFDLERFLMGGGLCAGIKRDTFRRDDGFFGFDFIVYPPFRIDLAIRFHFDYTGGITCVKNNHGKSVIINRQKFNKKNVEKAIKEWLKNEVNHAR